MAGSTPPPWSIPYPTGTDRVADGDNAMQALAERVAAISNALPRGFIYQVATTANFSAGDTILSRTAPITTTEARDFEFWWFGQIQPYTPAPGTGMFVLLETDPGGVVVGGASYLSWSDLGAANYYHFKWVLPAVAAGTNLQWRLHVAASGSNGHVITAGATFGMIDLGASGAI